MVLPANTEDLVKLIIQYGFLKNQGWKKQLQNVPECSDKDISACIEYVLNEKPHIRFNGLFILGLCRIHENNVEITLKLAHRLKAKDDELQMMLLSTSVPVLNFDIPKLTEVDVQECLRNGLKFKADVNEITLKEATFSEEWTEELVDEDLVTIDNILEEQLKFIQTTEEQNKAKLLVDTSGSEPGTSTSSPAGFPQQDGLIVSPVESLRSSIDPAENSTTENIGTSRGDSADFGSESFVSGSSSLIPDGSASSSIHEDDHPDPQTPLSEKMFIQDREEEVGGETEFDFDFDAPSPVRAPPPGPPVLGPPNATSTPIKKSRSCTTKAARELYLKKDDIDAPSRKKTRRQKRVTSSIKKTKSAKRARLVNDSGIVDDQDVSDSGHDDHQDSDFHADRMSPIHNYQDLHIPMENNDFERLPDQGDAEVDEMADHYNPIRMENNDIALDFSPPGSPRLANQDDNNVDEMADDPHYPRRMEGDDGEHYFSPPRSPLRVYEADDQIDGMPYDFHYPHHMNNDGAPELSPPRSLLTVDKIENQIDEMADSNKHSPNADNQVSDLGDSGFSETYVKSSDEEMDGSVEEKVVEQKVEKLANQFHRVLGQPAVKVPFSSILTTTETNKNRKEAAFSFYTLLHMAKNQQVEVTQAEPFGEIEITKTPVPGGTQQ